MLNNIRKTEYDLIISLGAACSCTEVLRMKDLQVFSYPLDWVLGSDFLNRVKIISENFENWFNAEDLKCVGKTEFPLPYDIYSNTRTGIIFRHDFPIFSQFEVFYKIIKEKYERRINRLLYQISNSKNVLFVYLERPDISEDVSAEELKMGYEILKKRFPNVDINILYFFNDKNVYYKNRKIMKVTNNITKIFISYGTSDKKYSQTVNFAPLLKVLESIQISDKFLNLKQKILKRINFVINIPKFEKTEKVYYKGLEF